MRRIPVWIKAPVVGFLIVEVGTKIWSLIGRANIRVSPEIPWSGPVMIFLLVVFFRVLNGDWFLDRSSADRERWFRANPVQKKSIAWVAVAGACLGGTLVLLTLLSWELVSVEFGPLRLIGQIRVYPWWTVAVLIVGTSVTAGIMEEGGFRGYMQKQLEEKYGVGLAILLVAIFFALIHLPGLTVTPALLPIFVLGSIGWGALAYVSNSVIPGMIVHALIDLIGYFWVWLYFEDAQEIARRNVFVDGVHAGFIIEIVLLIIFVSGFITALRKLQRLRSVI